MFGKSRHLFLVLAVALLFRCFLFFSYHPWDLSDDPSLMNDLLHQRSVFSIDTGRDDLWYHQSALNILSGVRVEPYRGPGYPFFIAVVYYLFGVHPWVVLLVQSVLDVFTVYLIYKISFLAFENRFVSFVSGVFYLLDVTTSYYVLQLMSESMHNLLFLLSVYITLHAARANSFVKLSLGGFFMALASYVRPAMLYYFLFVLFVLVFLTSRKKAVLSAVVAYFFVFSAVVFPLFLRNYMDYGFFSFSSVGGSHMCQWIASYVKARVDSIERSQASNILCKLNGTMRNPFVISSYRKSIAISYLSSHPVDFFWAYVAGVFGFLKETPLSLVSSEFSAYFTENGVDSGLAYSVLRIFNLIFVSVLYSLFLFAVLRGKKSFYIVFFFLSVCFFALVSGPNGASTFGRMRMPAQPFISILSAYGLSLVLKK
ncbi:MAG: glycosyltransferase family 39 protein [Candidatus Altiarchaeota archaeon]|nr:glycosyltransferase family 39 protein [Candidatus Altiarchaeota archaeon]